MGMKDHGYYGWAFIGARPLQFVALVTIVGLDGHFIAQIAQAKRAAPGELIGTMVIACISVLWTLLSFTAYDDSHIPYFVTCALDVLCLVPFVVLAALLGQPLSVTTCSDLPRASAADSLSFLALPVQQPGGGGGGGRGHVSYVLFAGAEQTTCYELMAAWGLSIALCCLFAISAFAMAFLFIGKRRAAAAAAAAAAGPEDGMDAELRDFAGPPGGSKEFDDGSSFHSVRGENFHMVAPPPPPPPSGPAAPPAIHELGAPRAVVAAGGAEAENERGWRGGVAPAAAVGAYRRDDYSRAPPPPPSSVYDDDSNDATRDTIPIALSSPLSSHPPTDLHPATTATTTPNAAPLGRSLTGSSRFQVNQTRQQINNSQVNVITISNGADRQRRNDEEGEQQRPVTRGKGGGSSRFREERDSVWLRRLERKDRKPVLVVPTSPVGGAAALEVVPPTPVAAAAERPKRKTIFEIIEGWWDLGLLRGGTVRGRTAPFPGGRTKPVRGGNDAAGFV
ncbi:uncharacterized protein E0L32_000358 [Thyridium curvatum]|uniref:MARVEL domain-containing protein n=1 Tax=Thyridium curvatum TaxID=1093900 RepID=A0A507BBK5_9PEZI|nr:uncharacterized protein E0L32_000358 [Thyridium curvatum]TPX16024.1 hypothetical protein E0L32_000358 [Thyridium curvatum]